MSDITERQTDAMAVNKRAEERMLDPIVDPRQKFTAGLEVYIRPIYESSMLHFDDNLITTVEGTYAQLYWGDNFDSYSTAVASWYHENQLMPTNGRTLEECRQDCKEYFGKNYNDMLKAKQGAIDSCPILKGFAKIFKEAFDKAFDETIRPSLGATNPEDGV